MAELPPLLTVAADGSPEERRETGILVGSRFADCSVVLARMVDGRALWRDAIPADEAEQIGAAIIDAARRARGEPEVDRG